MAAGVGVYISMRQFDDNLRLEQRGQEITDGNNLPDVLESIGLDMMSNNGKKFFMNVKASELDKIMKTAKDKCDTARMLVVIISSHGMESLESSPTGDKQYHHYTAFYDKWVKTKGIVEQFSNCIHTDKPKVFLIQACSTKDKDNKAGEKDNGTAAKKPKDEAEDKGVTIHLTENEPEQDLSGYSSDVWKENKESDGKNSGVLIPTCVRNSLVVFTSASGKYSYASETEGGWFLKNFAKEFEREEKEFFLLDFLKKMRRIYHPGAVPSRDVQCILKHLNSEP